MSCRPGLVALVLVACGLSRVPLAANDALSQYYAGLRERGLYRLAESDCLRRLSSQEIQSGERAHLSIELSRLYAEHAVQSSGQESEELWARASEVMDVLLKSDDAEPYRELLAAQRGLVDASRGAQLRWQVELFPLDDQRRKQAAEVLRTALERLKPLPAALNDRLRESLNRPAPKRSLADRPAPNRLRDAQRDVELQIAVASVDLAKVLPLGPDQVEALHRAEEPLRELTNTAKPDAAAWIAEVLLIEVLRLRGDLDQVGPRVTALLKKEPPPAIRDAAVAQWVRAELDAGQPDDALQRLQDHRRAHVTDSAELTHLLVETLLAARQLAFEKRHPELAADLLTQAESYASELTGAWGTRTRLLIEASREADTYGPELATHVRRAKWAWRNGNLEDAIAAYHQAVSEAHRAGQADYAVDFAITMATLQTEARRFTGAITTLTGLLDNYPDSPRAADAHLLRAYAIGRQYERDSDASHLTTYRSELEEHRSRFATSPTVVEATWMLARLEEHERNWRQAIELLETISDDSKRGPDAQARLAIVYESAIADRKQRGEPTDDLEQQAVASLKAAADDFPPPPDPLSDNQSEVAWRLARLLLGQQKPDFALADSLLERVLQGDQSAAADTTEHARVAAASQLRIISLAGQGRLEEARSFAHRLESNDPERLLDVLSGLGDAASQVALEHKKTVGTLQLELSQRLEKGRETLSDHQRLKLDESLAQAYAALGQIPQAAAVYEKILWQRPKDVRILESFARLSESSGTISDIRNASRQWEALERLQRKGSVEWLESRYHLAWCRHQLGDDEAARKLIGVTRVLYPDLGHPQLKKKFQDLAAELNTQPGSRRSRP